MLPLDSYPIVIDIPVRWGDMDAFQHVNNALYFRYLESSRIAYFDDLGLWQSMEETGVGPILAHTECRFRFPLSYPDSVSVGARVRLGDIGEDRFTMEHLVWSQSHERVVASGTGLVVIYDYHKKHKTALPADILAAIKQRESGQ
jgi:acyl-CoA thioester hydrolase